MNVAFVIGCASYTDPIPSLRFGGTDALAVARVLQDTCGVEEDDLVLLSDEVDSDAGKPRYTNVLRQLANGRHRYDRGRIETLFFFFSGHGYHSDEDGNEYLVLADSVGDELERTALPLQRLVARLQEWDPRHLVLFIDACREPVSEHRALEAEDAPALSVNGLLPSGNITFSSCTQGQRSYEHPDVKAGLFTAALCEALSDRGRCRTLHEVNAYLKRRVPELCRQYGKPAQNPSARLEPEDVLALDIVSASRRNQWRTEVPLGHEVRQERIRRRDGDLPSKLAVGVDLGTCNSLLAVLTPTGDVEIAPIGGSRSMMPSVVNFDHNLDYVVGWNALDADRTRPEGSVFHPKRDLGTPTQYPIYDRSLTPELVCSLLLRSMRQSAEEYLGRPIPAVIASYPAAYGIAQVNALRAAYDLAEWHVDRFVSEPAITGHLPIRPPKPEGAADDEDCAVVVDLGGGTLDVSLLTVGRDLDDSFRTVQVHATVGDGRLGGLDYDTAIEEYARERLSQYFGDLPLPPYVASALRREAVRAKQQLSQTDNVVMLIDGVEVQPGKVIDVPIFLDRSICTSIVGDLDARVTRVISDALAASEAATWGPSRDEVDYVILAGQATKLPSLRAAISAMLRVPLVDTYQDDAVIRALPIQAGVLNGQIKDTLMIDSIVGGIGLRLVRRDSLLVLDPSEAGEVIDLVLKDTAIPTKRSELFRAIPDPSGRAALQVVELPSATDLSMVRPLGIVELDVPRERMFEATVDVDANSTIVLEIQDKETQHRRLILLSGPPDDALESIRDQRLTGTIEESEGL